MTTKCTTTTAITIPKNNHHSHSYNSNNAKLSSIDHHQRSCLTLPASHSKLLQKYHQALAQGRARTQAKAVFLTGHHFLTTTSAAPATVSVVMDNCNQDDNILDIVDTKSNNATSTDDDDDDVDVVVDVVVAPQPGSRVVSSSSITDDDRHSSSSLGHHRDASLVVVVTTPRPNDVLFGRGRPLQGHPGNIRFHQIVNRYRDEYMTARKEEKVSYSPSHNKRSLSSLFNILCLTISEHNLFQPFSVVHYGYGSYRSLCS
jgi:hypothetical protein